MRQAITIAQSHAGEWKVIHAPDVPIEEQLDSAKSIAARSRVNEDFASLLVLSLDNRIKNFKFDNQAIVDARAKAIKQAEAEAEKAKAAAKKAEAKLLAKTDKADAARKAADHSLIDDMKKRAQAWREARAKRDAEHQAKVSAHVAEVKAKAEAAAKKTAGENPPAETPTEKK